MFKNLKPNLILNGIEDINTDYLVNKGIKLIISDIDNTLVPHNYPVPTKKALAFFDELNKHGIKVYFISNNQKERVDSFNKNLDYPFVCKAGKPRVDGFYKAIKDMNVLKNQAVVIGDQIFTDIWGGNRAGFFTIYVKPVKQGGEGWFIAFKRIFEKLFL